MIVLSWLKKWFKENSQNLEEKEIGFTFSKITKTDNPAQFVDVDTKIQMVRVTLWESGECNFEVLENDTAKSIFKYQKINSEKQLFDFLDHAFSEL